MHTFAPLLTVAGFDAAGADGGAVLPAAGKQVDHHVLSLELDDGQQRTEAQSPRMLIMRTWVSLHQWHVVLAV